MTDINNKIRYIFIFFYPPPHPNNTTMYHSPHACLVYRLPKTTQSKFKSRDPSRCSYGVVENRPYAGANHRCRKISIKNSLMILPLSTRSLKETYTNHLWYTKETKHLGGKRRQRQSWRPRQNALLPAGAF